MSGVREEKGLSQVLLPCDPGVGIRAVCFGPAWWSLYEAGFRAIPCVVLNVVSIGSANVGECGGLEEHAAVVEFL